MSLLLLLLACAPEPAGSAARDTQAPLDTAAPSPSTTTTPQTTPPAEPLPAPVVGETVPWWPRLTTSPAITWEPVDGATGYQLSVTRSGDDLEVGAWVDVAAPDAAHTHLWGVVDGDRLQAWVRAVGPDGPGLAAATPAWTVDIRPPTPPTSVDDTRVPVDGTVRWTGTPEDSGSGFSHFELRAGTAPGSGDRLDWTVVDGDEATLTAAWLDASWHWVELRAVDHAGNASAPVTSDGFIACPDDYLFVPSDAELGTDAFCIASVEARPSEGLHAATDPEVLPWAAIDTPEARLACDAIGPGYRLTALLQWQAVAHSITATAANWSGGVVGNGAIPLGHTDGVPAAALPLDGDPCGGTENPDCTDPEHADHTQRRDLMLANGARIWDFAGNLWEHVDSSTGGPDTLWVSFDHAAFDDADLRTRFAPRGDFTEAHGMGRMYGGEGTLVRGGTYLPTTPGVAGASGISDAGVHAAHHNSWSIGPTHGFRCTFTPM